MRRSGKSKAEVERETGSTIGVFDADFEVYRGEIFVIIGLSGSGKSTLLRLVNRLIEPTEGEVYLDGDLVSAMPLKQVRDVRRKKMGMVFQHFGLLPNKSVLDNVAFGLEIQGIAASERRERASETLDLVGLAGAGEQADRRALRRHEAAGWAGAGPRHGSGDTAHGRAVLRARPPDPARHAEPFPLHPGRGQEDGRLRNARPGRGPEAGPQGRDHEGRRDRAARDAGVHPYRAGERVRGTLRRGRGLRKGTDGRERDGAPQGGRPTRARGPRWCSGA